MGGIQTAPLSLIAPLMALVVAALWVGDHPRLARRNRRQVIVLDRAVTDETALTAHLESLLGGRVRSVEVQRLDLVNDTTLVDVSYLVPRTSAARTAGGQRLGGSAADPAARATALTGATR